MEALSSGTLERRFEALPLQSLSKILRAEFQRFKGNVGSRIKIEDHAVRKIDRVDRGAPGMKFHGAHLNYFQQSFFVFDVQVFVGLPLVLEFKRMDIGAQTFPGIPLKETLLIDSRRAAQQTKRMPHDLRQHQGRDRCIIFRKFALRDMADVGDDTAGMSNRDSVEHEVFRPSCLHLLSLWLLPPQASPS